MGGVLRKSFGVVDSAHTLKMASNHAGRDDFRSFPRRSRAVRSAVPSLVQNRSWHVKQDGRTGRVTRGRARGRELLFNESGVPHTGGHLNSGLEY